MRSHGRRTDRALSRSSLFGRLRLRGRAMRQTVPVASSRPSSGDEVAGWSSRRGDGGVVSGSADLRRRWSAGQPCHGVWSLLPGAVTGEVLARTGAEFVVVDLQHGAATEADLPGT